MYHTIFVPVDGKNGRSAVQHAAQLARLLGGRVVLATVVADAAHCRGAEARLTALGRLGRGSPTLLVRVAGKPDWTRTYLQLMREQRSDLVVLEPHSPLLTALAATLQVPALVVPGIPRLSAGARWLAAGQSGTAEAGKRLDPR
jgi:nucleotide-binding universal stress UspA family protein